MSSFNLEMFKHKLAKPNFNIESFLIWLNNKRTNCISQVPRAWGRVSRSYHGEDFKEALNYLNSLYNHIKWYELMAMYFSGFIEAENKDSYQMTYRGYTVCPKSCQDIYNVIICETNKFTDRITSSYSTIIDYLIRNNSSSESPFSSNFNNEVIAYCTLHKINLSWPRACRKNCFYRNDMSMCSNLLILRGPFWLTKAGQDILKSTAISSRVRYRRN